MTPIVEHDIPTLLPLDVIRLKGGTRSRADVDPEVIEEYAEAYRKEAQFPPIEVFSDGKLYWLVDGFHRVEAAKKAGLTELSAIIHQGTLKEAMWFSCSVNQTHGRRRTNEDKQVVVIRTLTEAPQKSNYQIAEHCGVSHTMVKEWRKKRTAVRQSVQAKMRCGRDGRTRNITNIGKKRQSPASRTGEQILAAPPEPMEAIDMVRWREELEKNRIRNDVVSPVLNAFKVLATVNLSASEYLQLVDRDVDFDVLGDYLEPATDWLAKFVNYCRSPEDQQLSARTEDEHPQSQPVALNAPLQVALTTGASSSPALPADPSLDSPWPSDMEEEEREYCAWQALVHPVLDALDALRAVPLTPAEYLQQASHPAVYQLVYDSLEPAADWFTEFVAYCRSPAGQALLATREE